MRYTLGVLPLIVLTGWLSAHPMPAQEPKPPAERPLSHAQLLALAEDGVSGADLLFEAELRKLDFLVSADVVRELTTLGVSKRLIQNLSPQSLPLQADLNALARHVTETRHERVVELATVLANKSPMCLLPVWLRGQSHLESGNLTEAVKDFQRLLDEAPEYLPQYAFVARPARPAVMIARTYRLSKQPAKSVAVLNRLLTQHPELASYDVFLERALAFTELKDFSSARSDLLSSLKAGPREGDVYLAAADCLTTCGSTRDRDAASARALALAAVELVGTAPQACDALACVAAAEAELGNFEAAADWQLRAAACAPIHRKRDFDERLAVFRGGEKPWADAERTSSLKAAPDIRRELFQSLLRIEGGKFRMGSAHGGADEAPVHEVEVPAFLIGRHEITRGEWRAVMGEAPPGDADLPIDNVSWEQCREFVTRLNRGLDDQATRFRLPTEAEWESAARAGTETRYYFGDGPQNLKDHAWYAEGPEFGPRPVGQKKPNPLGLVDAYGNVAEWCADDYVVYGKTPAPGDTNAPQIQLKVLRGGSWTNSAARCTSSARAAAPQKERRRGWGLRLAADDKPFPKAVPSQPAPAESAARPNLLDLAVDSLTAEVRDANTVPLRTQKRANLAKLLIVRGYARRAEKNPSGALESFREALHQVSDPKSPEAWQTRCLAAWLQATSATDDRRTYDPRAASEAATTALGLTEFKHWLPYTVLAAAQAEIGDFDKAVLRAQQALDQAPPEFRDECRRRLTDYQFRRTSRGEGLPWPLVPPRPPAP